MDQLLRVGIAGYGIVGKRRHGVIVAHGGMEVVGVCDQVPERMADVPGTIARYDHYDDLIKEPLDLLFVCISNDRAAEVTIKGLERGLHVFCEKPPGRNLAELEAVLETENKLSGLKLKYGFNHRYHHSVQDALKIVAAGELGKVVNLRGMYGKSQMVTFGAESDWRIKRDIAGGGILLDQGIHMVDLLRLYGGEFNEVRSFVSNSYWNHDVEDNAYALMRSPEGVVAMLHSSATQWRHRFELDITLEKGALILGGILSGSKSYGQETLTIARATGDDRGAPSEEFRQYDTDPSWADEVSDFYDAVTQDQAVENGSSADAYKTFKLVYDIYSADQDWRERWGIEDSRSISD